MLVLIDADTLCYASASMAEGEGEGLARYNLDEGLAALLLRLNNPEHRLYITGNNNFRYKVYPEYKANRLNVPRPEHLKACQDYIVSRYNAIVSDGNEADDLLGIEQTTCSELGIETMISSIDKDLDQIPGWHYSPEIKRKGVVVKEARRYVMSPMESLRFFYYQLLIGDPTDNIKGVRGCGPVKATEILSEGHTEEDWYHLVRAAYGCDEEMEMNAKVLWIWKKENDDVTERWRVFRNQPEVSDS